MSVPLPPSALGLPACAAGAPMQGITHSLGPSDHIAALRLPFGLPFGREHFVVPALRSPTRSLSPYLRGSSLTPYQSTGGSAILPLS